MNSSAVVQKFNTSSKYYLRQKQDILKYGKKLKVKRFGITLDMLNEITPNRRLSQKPIKLSDPQYFIDKFIKENGEQVCPINWQDMSLQEKTNFIVKDRYTGLVANRIMDKIQNLPIEHCYGLNRDGELVSFDTGESDNVKLSKFARWWLYVIKHKLVNEFDLSSTTVHNHPQSLEKLTEFIEEKHPDKKDIIGEPQSDKDLHNTFFYASTGCVVDTYGHKYKFTPKRIYCCQLNWSLKIKNFMEKMHDLRNRKKTEPEKRIESILERCKTEENIENLVPEIYENFYLLRIHDTKNIYAKTDQIYALSDFGRFQQLK